MQCCWFCQVDDPSTEEGPPEQWCEIRGEDIENPETSCYLIGCRVSPAHSVAERRDPSETPTILVVDDEVLICMVVCDYLRECGYRVVEAGNGDEAVTALKTDTHVDVVFTDVRMPGALDGFGLAQWVHRERPGVRVILTSGIARAAQEAGDLCEDGSLLAKPYDPREVERRIRALLASQ